MLTIFLAEDDVDDQELLADAFHQIDPTVNLVSFATGKKLISHLQGLSDDLLPALIILDYNLPEINGADILKYLDKDKKYHAIVKLVWSTSNASLYEASCLALGAEAYFVKPSNISGLTELAGKMMEYTRGGL